MPTIAKRMVCKENKPVVMAADVFSKFNEWRPYINPEKFRPLTFGRNGHDMSVSGGRETDASFLLKNWLWCCHGLNGSAKNSLLCLAMNFDDHPGMIALILESAGNLTGFPRTENEEKIHLSHDDHAEIVEELFGNNYGDIWKVSHRWGVRIRPGAKTKPIYKTRHVWGRELGHDVLIHPRTLQPCNHLGLILKYEGIVTVGESAHFKFSAPKTDIRMVQSMFMVN